MPYMESLLCRRWGCPPTALDDVPEERIHLELAFMVEESRAQEAMRPPKGRGR